jgi:hypothetical protein
VARCITFPRLIAYPPAFLTLCSRVEYTNKFKTSLERGLSDAPKNRRGAKTAVRGCR